MLPVILVHAADGKAAQAEPVAVLFEAGKAKFAGAFPELEVERAGFTPAGWQGNGASSDRADDEQVATSPGCGCSWYGP